MQEVEYKIRKNNMLVEVELLSYNVFGIRITILNTNNDNKFTASVFSKEDLRNCVSCLVTKNGTDLHTILTKFKKHSNASSISCISKRYGPMCLSSYGSAGNSYEKWQNILYDFHAIPFWEAIKTTGLHELLPET